MLPDLGSHLLDTCRFWFGDIAPSFAVTAANSFENRAPDHVVIASEGQVPRFELEMTLLMWRNHFTCDVLAEKGTAHITSLCKWGPANFIQRTRVLPSGRPARDDRDADPGRSDLGGGIRSLPLALRARGADGSFERPLAAPRAFPSRRRGRGAGGPAMKPVVGFAGMTHLGLVSASAVAGAGFETVCFDRDEALVADLRRGRLPVLEPDLPELIAANGARQTFSANAADIARCDVVYVAPDIATDDEGRSDDGLLRELIDLVRPVLRTDAVLVVLSQVEPGFTRSMSVPEPARRYYQVETLVFGRAVERATKPERIIVGCADPAQPLDPRYRAVLDAFELSGSADAL